MKSVLMTVLVAMPLAVFVSGCQVVMPVNPSYSAVPVEHHAVSATAYQDRLMQTSLTTSAKAAVQPDSEVSATEADVTEQQPDSDQVPQPAHIPVAVPAAEMRPNYVKRDVSGVLLEGAIAFAMTCARSGFCW